MAYDQQLAERIGKVMKRYKGVEEKKMFGGVCYLLNGNMCCGVVGDNLMLRVGKDLAAMLLLEKHVREMDFTKRVIKSMVYILPEGLQSDEQLKKWLKHAIAFVKTLPAK